jgi:hypothetical protein
LRRWLLVVVASDIVTTLLFIQHPLAPDWHTAKLWQSGLAEQAFLQSSSDVKGEMLPATLPPSFATKGLSAYPVCHWHAGRAGADDAASSFSYHVLH